MLFTYSRQDSVFFACTDHKYAVIVVSQGSIEGWHLAEEVGVVSADCRHQNWLEHKRIHHLRSRLAVTRVLHLQQTRFEPTPTVSAALTHSVTSRRKPSVRSHGTLAMIMVNLANSWLPMVPLSRSWQIMIRGTLVKIMARSWQNLDKITMVKTCKLVLIVHNLFFSQKFLVVCNF